MGAAAGPASLTVTCADMHRHALPTYICLPGAGYLVSQRFVGETADVEVLRGGEPLQLQIECVARGASTFG